MPFCAARAAARNRSTVLASVARSSLTNRHGQPKWALAMRSAISRGSSTLFEAMLTWSPSGEKSRTIHSAR